ncbi:MAG: peptidylprolyl isomerase [bacterium]|nr:peptidylprolyl isomerase [bacterium]
MRTLTTLTLAVFVIFAACKRAENKSAQPEQTQTQTETMKQAEPSGKLQKFPADYPITGDSVAVIAVEQEGVGPLGTLVIEFYADKAPNHVRNFKWLADHKFYDGTKFHRVIKNFMIQGGDPQGTGTGGPGWNVDAEFNDVSHVKGVLSMARSQDPNSAGSQFFICHGSPSHLDHQYTAFGKVVKGLEVVDKVAAVPVGGPQKSTPLQNVIMTSVTIVPRAEAMPK